MKTTTKTTATKKINYSLLPQALRLAIAKEVVLRIANGEAPAMVAKEFGATIALVNSWVKRDSEGTLGKRLHDDKVTTRIDHRNLPDAPRIVARKVAMEKIKNGNGIAKTARELGTTEMSIRRWMDGDEAGFESYAKRGRKAHVVVEPTTEVAPEVTTEVQA
jgi:hypothetical protein